MSNASRLFRYRIASSGGATARNFFVRADVNSNTLILNGLTNAESLTESANNTYRIILPSRGGLRSKTTYARSVLIRITAAGAGLSVGSRCTVPVFTFGQWNTYQINQVGTYQGFACICIGKDPGSPQNNGREF